jgi:hypothetical protein
MHPATLEHLATLHHRDLECDAANARLASQVRGVKKRPAGDERSGAHHVLSAAIAGGIAGFAVIAGIVAATWI